jgi:dihydrodipicolinate reductase
MSELNIVIVGAAGRMGRTLIESVLATPGARLHAAVIVPVPTSSVRMPACSSASRPA